MKLLRPVEIGRKLGVSTRTVHRLWATDPSFPAKVKLSDNVAGAIDEQLDEWMLRRASEARKVPA